jgi:hypothetical protein
VYKPNTDILISKWNSSVQNQIQTRAQLLYIVIMRLREKGFEGTPVPFD